jgi:sugar phosphate isomerase/epimerase
VEVLEQAVSFEEALVRFSVATISLPDHDLESAAAGIRAAGFEGVEWRVEPRAGSIRDMMPGHPFLVDHRSSVALDVPAAIAAADLTRRHGLELVGLGAYIELDDDQTLSTAFAMAKAAGAPQVRLQAPRPGRTGSTYSELFPRFVDFFAKVEAEATRTGIRALLEIHHRTICPSAALAHRVLERFDPARVGAIYDVGNLVWEGYVDHEIALDQLGPYLAHVHVKNATLLRRPGGGWEPAWTPLEDGAVDVPGFLTLLGERGYDGWVSIEELSLDRTPAEALVHNAAELRRWGFLTAPSGR